MVSPSSACAHKRARSHSFLHYKPSTSTPRPHVVPSLLSSSPLLPAPPILHLPTLLLAPPLPFHFHLALPLYFHLQSHSPLPPSNPHSSSCHTSGLPLLLQQHLPNEFQSLFGVTRKRRCTYRPSVLYLIVNKLLSLSLNLCLVSPSPQPTRPPPLPPPPHPPRRCWRRQLQIGPCSVARPGHTAQRMSMRPCWDPGTAA